MAAALITALIPLAGTVQLHGDGSAVVFASTGASLSATCGGTPSISFMTLASNGNFIGDVGTLSSLPDDSVNVFMTGLAPGCGNAPMTTPCISSAEDPKRPGAFYCEWDGPEGKVVSDAVSATATNSFASISCKVPTIDKLLASGRVSDAGLNHELALKVWHYVQMSASDSFETAATEIPYAGPYGADRLSISLLAIPSPDPPPPPAPPPPPSPTATYSNGHGGTYVAPYPAGGDFNSAAMRANARAACESVYGAGNCDNNACGSCDDRGYHRTGGGTCNGSIYWNYRSTSQSMDCGWVDPGELIVSNDNGKNWQQ